LTSSEVGALLKAYTKRLTASREGMAVFRRKTGLSLALANVYFWEKKRAKNWWDSFKNTLWDSMGPRDEVGQDKHLKLNFYLRPPLGTSLRCFSLRWSIC
jgi:hypothetical protein